MNEESKIRALVEKPLQEKGFDLYSLKLVLGKEARLEVVVDRVEPIGLDEVVELSNLVNDILDKEDPIEGAYVLDLSSAGAEKEIPLEKLGSYVGRYVHLHLSHPVEGENILEGTLSEYGQEAVLETKVKTRKKAYRFPSKDIDGARLAIEF